MINYDCGGFNYTYHIWSRRQCRKCCGEGMRGLYKGLPNNNGGLDYERNE
jgi:hypothetical protein